MSGGLAQLNIRDLHTSSEWRKNTKKTIKEDMSLEWEKKHQSSNTNTDHQNEETQKKQGTHFPPSVSDSKHLPCSPLYGWILIHRPQDHQMLIPVLLTNSASTPFLVICAMCGLSGCPEHFQIFVFSSLLLTKVTSRKSSSSLISEKAAVMLAWKSFHRRQNCSVAMVAGGQRDSQGKKSDLWLSLRMRNNSELRVLYCGWEDMTPSMADSFLREENGGEGKIGERRRVCRKGDCFLE